MELWQWPGRGGGDRDRGGRGGEEAVGVSVVVFMVLSQDKVLKRFVEQIIGDDKAGLGRVQQRFVEQNFETPCDVWWCRSPT